MTDALPAPLCPADCDLQDFPFMPLHVARLRDSDFAAEELPEACWYGVLLWAASWHQVPAGSLPNNDVVLMKMAGLGRDTKTWKKHRAGALRGFVECRDGRLYHPVIAEQVVAAWDSKLRQRHRTLCATVRKHLERNPGAEVRSPSYEEWMSHGRPTAIDDLVASMSRVTAPDAERDIASKRQGQGQGESNIDVGAGAASEQVDPKPTGPKPSEAWPPEGSPGTGLSGQLARVCEAGGIAIDPSHRRWAEELTRLKGWLETGFDFEGEILPAVDRAVRKLPVDDTLATLKPVERELRGAKAKARVARQAFGTASSTPTAQSIIARPGDSPDIARWRGMVAAEIGIVPYRNWIEPVAVTAVDDELRITASSAFAAQRVEAEYRHAIESAAAQVFGRAMLLRVQEARAA